MSIATAAAAPYTVAAARVFFTGIDVLYKALVKWVAFKGHLGFG
jgi:hypothetical protein